jgi:hypothetical protein
MTYREQHENYWPTPEQLRACRENNYKRPQSPLRIPHDADWGLFVVVALLWGFIWLWL